MMKKVIFATTIFLLATIATTWGQEPKVICGTTIEDQAQYTARLQTNIAVAQSGDFVRERGAIQYVPIYFHLVGDANGLGKHKERLILDQLCDLNEAYAPMDIRFYLKPHPTYGLFDYSINNNNVYNNQTNTFLMQSRKHQNAVNVYVVQDPGSGNGGTVQAAAYYNPTYDWIVAAKDYVDGSSGGNGTLPHEVGHFFSLRHTFYGFETNPFDNDDDPTWPIAPVIGPAASIGFNAPTERVDGSNCSTAADLICDTPAEYNFGQTDPNQDCSYNNIGAKDPLGVPVTDPMENNYMSYYNACNYVFSPIQQDVILLDRETVERNFLDNNFAPATESITTPTTDQFLVGPENGVTTTYYDEVLLEWNAVAGATYYLLEIDGFYTFSTGKYRSYVVSGTSKFFTDLEDNQQYYWRVRPFNEYVTCAQPRQRNFKTSFISAVKNIESLSALQVAPNPASGDAAVRLFVSASDNFEASIRVLDATGRQLRSLDNQHFTAGETTLDLPTEGLANGFYFVAIENAEGRAVRKLTILR